jgi:hypothetical protein
VKEIEGEILSSLKILVGGSPCACYVREARSELTPEEFGKLSPQQKEKRARLHAPGRVLEWSEARRCEMALHTQLGPEARTSISHTRNEGRPIVFSIGAVRPEPVGIDVELRTRAVSEAAARRFMSDEERRLGLQPLQVWVVKEALMKATPENAGTVPGQYRLHSYDPVSRTGIGGLDRHPLRFVVIDLPEWVISVAAT